MDDVRRQLAATHPATPRHISTMEVPPVLVQLARAVVTAIALAVVAAPPAAARNGSGWLPVAGVLAAVVSR